MSHHDLLAKKNEKKTRQFFKTTFGWVVVTLGLCLLRVCFVSCVSTFDTAFRQLLGVKIVKKLKIS